MVTASLNLVATVKARHSNCAEEDLDLCIYALIAYRGLGWTLVGFYVFFGRCSDGVPALRSYDKL